MENAINNNTQGLSDRTIKNLVKAVNDKRSKTVGVEQPINLSDEEIYAVVSNNCWIGRFFACLCCSTSYVIGDEEKCRLASEFLKKLGGLRPDQTEMSLEGLNRTGRATMTLFNKDNSIWLKTSDPTFTHVEIMEKGTLHFLQKLFSKIVEARYEGDASLSERKSLTLEPCSETTEIVIDTQQSSVKEACNKPEAVANQVSQQGKRDSAETAQLSTIETSPEKQISISNKLPAPTSRSHKTQVFEEPLSIEVLSKQEPLKQEFYEKIEEFPVMCLKKVDEDAILLEVKEDEALLEVVEHETLLEVAENKTRLEEVAKEETHLGLSEDETRPEVAKVETLYPSRVEWEDDEDIDPLNGVQSNEIQVLLAKFPRHLPLQLRAAVEDFTRRQSFDAKTDENKELTDNEKTTKHSQRLSVPKRLPSIPLSKSITTRESTPRPLETEKLTEQAEEAPNLLLYMSERRAYRNSSFYKRRSAAECAEEEFLPNSAYKKFTGLEFVMPISGDQEMQNYDSLVAAEARRLEHLARNQTGGAAGEDAFVTPPNELPPLYGPAPNELDKGIVISATLENLPKIPSRRKELGRALKNTAEENGQAVLGAGKKLVKGVEKKASGFASFTNIFKGNKT
ncbi:MAG: hypothetical protein K0R08_2017 [Solimicrobium sp.]|jgi:hypothetical protein|nr:hypothetical protein [Solimicrobium sp.]